MQNIPEKFLKPYSPTESEGCIYELWEKSGFFNPDNLPPRRDGAEREPYTIVLPPPNVTGTLHMGSALMAVIEDILIRQARMAGKATLWLPGTDSAAIATQAKVEKEIQKKEGKNRHDLGRDELLRRIDIFVEENKSTILKQFRAIGASLDWSRYAYTMDTPRYRAVMEAFKRMYDAGLIYREHRIVNWDPKGQTVISDDEIVYEEREATLYTFRYFPEFPIAISTTRPETKVGDTAVAVHPDDERYRAFVGKEFTGTFAGTALTLRIIADESVDKEFGTGALGVTPAHSQADWEIAERHALKKIQIIDERARMTEIAGTLVAGLKVGEAREKIVAWIKENGLMQKEEKVSQNVSTAERTGGIVEPLPKLQWWVAVDKPFTLAHSEIPSIPNGSSVTLKEIMRKAVVSGAVNILPDRFNAVYFNWINNLRPWCISRQIWFGHRIPVWYNIADENSKNQQYGMLHYKKGLMFDLLGPEHNAEFHSWMKKAEEDKPELAWGEFGDVRIVNFAMVLLIREKYKLTWSQIKEGAEIIITKNMPPESAIIQTDVFDEDSPYIQESDTLDTWFSSALWTFSTLGWPEETPDIKRFHPTTVLETGYDILFFWVARMILMSGFHLGQIPFKTVYLHGLVRDGQGRKISKSLGNNIDPIEMGEKYGMDAVRMSLIVGTAPGADSRMSEDKIKAYKHFANKLWNIARFVLGNADECESNADQTRLRSGSFGGASTELCENDVAHMQEIEMLAKEVTADIENFRLHLAAEKLYQYVWHRFADEIIEESKPIFAGEDMAARASRAALLYRLLTHSLKLLHPFMPFITEEIWQSLPKKENEILMVAEWPSGV